VIAARTPVLIGAAQLIQHAKDPARALGPLEMMERIARDAAADSGAGEGLLQSLDTVGIVDVAAWSPKNAARLVAQRLGARPSTEIVTRVGGEMALRLVNEVAERILVGTTRLAFVAGANSLDSLRRKLRSGGKPTWDLDGDGEPIRLGEQRLGSSETETLYGLARPTDCYPVIENALRARRGLSPAEHQRRLGALMQPFTRVAAGNPYAWFPVERTVEELITPGPDNRMISYPYPKYLNAVIVTDQAAGVLLCDAETAHRLGVPEERWLYWWGGADTSERAWHLSQRPELDTSAALHECARRTFANTGTSIDEIDHLDFYSCFPVAVEVACEAYGVAEDDPRGLTVTGGLPYAGGPANNYSLHSLAAMVPRLRARRGDKGLVTGNGWYLTKHSSSLWCGQPRSDRTPTHRSAEGPEVGPEPLPLVASAEGPARIASYTVTFDREGAPVCGVVVGTLEAGGRFLANTPVDRALLEELLSREGVGRRGRVCGVDGKNVFQPE